MFRRIAALVLVAVLSGGCSGRGDALVVFAAASLSDAFADIATAFEQTTGIDVATVFAASSSLREQILSGAPGDVFASADRSELAALAAASAVIGEPAVFATNTMVIAVPLGNPGAVTGPGDLADPELLVGLCAPEVPCGSLARAILDGSGVVPALDTEEPNVRALLTKIEAGELDAGIVYRTDVIAADVETVEIPGAGSFVAEYPIAVLAGARHPDGGARFLAFVLSDDGKRILEQHGFGLP